MGNVGCNAEQPNGGHVERSSKNMEATRSPVFIGQMANYGGGDNAPQSHCPPMPPTVPQPPCGGRTDNCEVKGEAKRLEDKAETVTCNVTEYRLQCKWVPEVVPKNCTVMVPQYKAVCSGAPDGPKKMSAVVQQKYNVPVNFDADQNGMIDQSEFEKARAAGALQAVGGQTIVGGQAGPMAAAAFGGAGMGQAGAAMGQVGGVNMNAQMGGAQMGGGYGAPQMGGGYGN